MAENEWLTKDFYKELGVEKDADQATITKAYRKLARTYHPDVNKEAGAEERFKAISEAYDVLNDPQQRKRYDAIRQLGAGGARFTGGAGGSGGFDASGFSDIFSSMFGGGDGYVQYATSGGGNPNLNDIFSMFGGGAGGAAGATGRSGAYGNPFAGAGGAGQYASQSPVKGGDITSKVSLTFAQALKGATVSLSVGGHKFKTKVPAGVVDGQTIRIPGKGKVGQHGGASGDLYLTIRVNPDERWRIEGSDLVTELPISIGQAVNGAKLTIHDFNGQEVSVKVPAGSSSGDRLEVNNEGVPGKKGKLIAVVAICVPRKPKLKAKKLAREFDELDLDFVASLEQEL